MPATDWHADAIRLSYEGRSTSEIAEALGQKGDTVKKYLARIKKAPQKALATVTAAGAAAPPAAVDLSPDQNARLAEVITKTQELQAETDEEAYRVVRSALRLTHPDKLAFAKANIAIEYMKARKGSVSLTVNNNQQNIQNNIGVTPGGTLERLETLARAFTDRSTLVLPDGTDGGESPGS